MNMKCATLHELTYNSQGELFSLLFAVDVDGINPAVFELQIFQGKRSSAFVQSCVGFEVGVGNVSAIILPIPFNDLHNKSSIVSVFPCNAGGARSKRSSHWSERSFTIHSSLHIISWKQGIIQGSDIIEMITAAEYLFHCSLHYIISKTTFKYLKSEFKIFSLFCFILSTRFYDLIAYIQYIQRGSI